MGYRLYETTALTKQIQRRTHKKKRINKKWLKRYGYKTVLDNERIIIVEDCIFATPKTLAKLINEIKSRSKSAESEDTE
jgi:hypothetical protein